jgi:hypothetical protein
LLYNHMHKFTHILCEDCEVGGSAILYYAGLTTPVSYWFNLICIIITFKWMQYHSGTTTDVEYVIHLLVNIYIIYVFPDRLKYAIKRTLFKKGNNNDMSNYRPILILTLFSKRFDK